MRHNNSEDFMPTVVDILKDFGTTYPETPTHIDLPLTIDPHVHLRDETDGRLAMTLAECDAAHAVVIDIGNTATEVTSLALVEERDAVVQRNKPPGSNLRVYYSPLIGRGGDMNIMRDIRDQSPDNRKAVCVKIFFEGVSNARTSITDVEQIRFIIEESTRGDLPPTPITWHAECLKASDGRMIPIKDREHYCVTKQVERALKFNPDAVHVIRHVSDRRTIQWAQEMRRLGFNVHLEQSMQYLLHTNDSIFMADDGSHAILQCDCIYWPRPKDEADRCAAIALAQSRWFFRHIGNDFAMHLDDMSFDGGVKINSAGKAVGGLNFRPRDAKSILIDLCMASRNQVPNTQELLSGLLHGNAARVYGIEMPSGTERYVQQDSIIPSHTHGKTPDGREVKARCFLAGHTMHWQREVA
jgi:dihydroorotase